MKRIKLQLSEFCKCAAGTQRISHFAISLLSTFFQFNFHSDMFPLFQSETEITFVFSWPELETLTKFRFDTSFNWMMPIEFSFAYRFEWKNGLGYSFSHTKKILGKMEDGFNLARTMHGSWLIIMMNEQYSFHVKNVFIWNVKDPISIRIIFQTMNYLSLIMWCRVSSFGYEKRKNHWITSHLWFVNYGTTTTHGKWNRIKWNEWKTNSDSIQFTCAWNAIGVQKHHGKSKQFTICYWMLNIKQITMSFGFSCPYIVQPTTNYEHIILGHFRCLVYHVLQRELNLSTIHINFSL